MLERGILFLLDTATGFFTALLLLRFAMQLCRVSFGNPLGAFVVQLTNWAVLPLRRVVPGIFGLDLSSLLPAYLLQALLLVVALALRGGVDLIVSGGFLGVLLWQALLATLRVGVYLLIGALFLQAILSWVNPYSPLGGPLMQLTRPVLRPIQRVVPPIANVDLSPFVAIVLAQLVLLFL